MSASLWRDEASRGLLGREPLKLLLIEDDPSYQVIVRAVLTRAGEAWAKFPDLRTALTLTEGLSWLAAEPFDLVLLDLTLPESSGAETLARVVEAAPTVPIIVVTASDDGDLAATVLRNGAQDYLVKGASDDILYAIGRTILRHRHFADALSAAEHRARQERERVAVGERIHGPGPTPAHLDRAGPAFADFVTRYRDLVDDAVRLRLIGTDPGVRRGRRSLGTELAKAGASGTDVIAVHAAAVRLATESIIDSRALEWWLEESRLAVLDLLAAALDAYRPDPPPGGPAG